MTDSNTTGALSVSYKSNAMHGEVDDEVDGIGSIPHDGDTMKIVINGAIDEWMIDSQGIIAAINNFAGSEIHVDITTEGGSAFIGLQIRQALKLSNAEITTRVIGLAASAGTIISMAGDKRLITESSLMMIHRSWQCVCGDANELDKVADSLRVVDDIIFNIYTDAVEGNEIGIAEAINGELLLTTDDCMSLGLVTGVVSFDTGAANSSRLFDLSAYDKGKQQAMAAAGILAASHSNERVYEKALRDAGASRKTAKEILSKGVKGCRDDSYLDDVRKYTDALNLRDADSGVLDDIEQLTNLIKGDK